MPPKPNRPLQGPTGQVTPQQRMSYIKRLDTIMKDGKFSIVYCDESGNQHTAPKMPVPLVQAKEVAKQLAADGYTMCATGFNPRELKPGQMCIQRTPEI